jgi:hypothetical protein
LTTRDVIAYPPLFHCNWGFSRSFLREKNCIKPFLLPVKMVSVSGSYAIDVRGVSLVGVAKIYTDTAANK